MPALVFDNVSKVFSRRRGRQLLAVHLKEALGGKSKDGQGAFTALKDISFSIDHGESVGLIGPNGAGKSTLLSLTAGLTEPDAGSVAVEGRIAALLELGSGFHYDLTGEENALLNAALLGLTRQQAREALPRITEFSGLSEFLKQPLRTYSAGMVMRLAFSVAVNVDPDILLIDEVMAVGDAEFQEKCHETIFDFQRRGKTIFLVSHSDQLLTRFCERLLWLHHGRLRMDGPTAEVLEAYAESIKASPQTA
jgi:ABC-type polysaccharide/polyol phosphate transport system ATPase subunit